MTFPELLSKHGVAPPPCHSDCPSGWIPILDEALGALVELGWDRQLAQVKEKFGSLRIYLAGTFDRHVAYEQIVYSAERRSAYTCDVCGNNGAARYKNNWWITRCEAHQ